MTTTPATPELVRQAIGFYSHSPDGQYDEIAVHALRHYLATLQAQPAEVSDEEIERIAIESEMVFRSGGKLLTPFLEHIDLTRNVHAFARAILALRPQAVPMTDEQFTQLLRKLKRSREVFQAGRDSYETACAPMNSDDEAWSAYLAHHGITAPAGGEG